MTEQSTGKGRPTPKRSKQGRGPVAPPPTDRKEAARRLREKNAASRAEVRASYARGDDEHLLPRDKGPDRKLVRDVVDSRRNLATLILPVMLANIAIGISGSIEAQAFAFGIVLATVAAAVLDSFMLAFLIRRAQKQVFGEVGRGHTFYGITRALSFRRLRRPKPGVASPSLLPRRKVG